MQDSIIQFNFVCSKSAIKVKNFLNKIPRNIECINYMTVLNKLAKNDYLQYEPSDAVISSYLIKSIQQALSSEETSQIYYVVSDVDEITIKNIISYIESQTNCKLEYTMYHTSDVNLTDSKYLFKSIIQFD